MYVIFQIEKDTANIIKHKLMGCPLILKKGVLPHKFECQGKIKSSRSTGEKRSRQNIIAEAIKNFNEG